MDLIERISRQYGVAPDQISRLRVRGDEKISFHITLGSGEVRRYRISPAELELQPEPEPDEYICADCGRAFPTERGLLIHARIHAVQGDEEE